MKFNVDNVEIYQADYIKKGPVPYHEKFVREKDFLAALAERDAKISNLEDHIAKLEQLARDLDAKLTESEAIIFHSHPVTT